MNDLVAGSAGPRHSIGEALVFGRHIEKILAQQVARHDMQRGVSSRARKRRQGLETVPDPSEGARPGRPRSKRAPR